MRRLCLYVLIFLLLLPAGCTHKTEPSEQTPEPQDHETAPAAPEAGIYIPQTDASAGMNDPDFWAALCDAPDEVRMTPEEIAAFNAEVLADPETLCVDLDKYPDTLSRAELKDAVETYGLYPDAARYTGADRISGAQQGEIHQNLNLDGIGEQNAVRFGFSVRDCALRTWPSALPLYGEANDVEYDLARESTLHTWERIAVLHISADGAWLLVQAYNYIGWVSAGDVALTDRQSWQALWKQDFVMVRAPRLVLGGSAYDPQTGGTVLTVGTRLPLTQATAADNAGLTSAYAVLLPMRGADGTLKTAVVRIPYGDDVCAGYAKFTERELLRQVFRLLGQRYGWGGMFGGWDCSSLCADTYAVFGVRLPRNSSRQARVGASHDVSAASDEQKMALLSDLRPGALLELKGHMMFWLGVYEGKGYVIHSTHGFQNPGQDFYVSNSVVVSSVDVLRSDGASILTNIRAVGTVENP